MDRSFFRALKDRVDDEDTNYEQQISLYKKNYPSVYDLQFLQQNMFVIPLVRHSLIAPSDYGTNKYGY
jgi:hypothetical protein